MFAIYIIERGGHVDMISRVKRQIAIYIIKTETNGSRCKV